MSTIKARVDRLVRQEWPPAVIGALRLFQRRLCADWLRLLTGQPPKPFTERDTYAAHVFYNWGKEHGYKEAEDVAPADVAGLLAYLESMTLADSSATVAALKVWAKQQRAAGLDPDAELVRLRDKFRDYYATAPVEGEGVAAIG